MHTFSSYFEPDDLAQLEAIFKKAQRAGLLRTDLDIIVMILLVQQVCWSALATLPIYQFFLAERNFSSATILTYVREQIIAFLVAGIMNDP